MKINLRSTEIVKHTVEKVMVSIIVSQ